MKDLLKVFLKDSFWYSLHPIFKKLFTFLLIPIYTKYLTTEDYGNLQYILAFGTFFSMFVKMGLTSSFWKYRAGNSGYKKTDVTLNFTLTQLFIAVNMLIISLIVKFLFYKNAMLALFIIIFFGAETINTVFDNTILVLRANHKTKTYLLATTLQTLILLLLNVLFVVRLKMNYEGIIYSYLLTYFINTLIFIPFLIKESGGKINLKLVRLMLIYGAPLMLGNVAANVIKLSDRLFLKEMVSADELGLYTYGYKYAELVNSLLIGTFFMAWNPLRWDIYEMKNSKEVFSRFNKVLFIILPFACWLILGVAVLLAGFLTVDKEFLGGMKIIFIIGFSYALFGLYYFNTMGMLFENKTANISIIVVLSGLTNIGLNFLLIPDYGMLGASVATIISYILMFVIARIYCQKYYPIKRDNFFEISQLVLNIILVVVITYFTYKTENLYYIAGMAFAASFILIGTNLSVGNIKKDELMQFKTMIMEARKKFKKRKSGFNDENDI